MVIKLRSTVTDLTSMGRKIVYENTETLQELDGVTCDVEVPDITWEHVDFKPGMATVVDDNTIIVSTLDKDKRNTSHFKENEINEAQHTRRFLGFQANASLPLQEELKIHANNMARKLTLGFVGNKYEVKAEIVWEPSTERK